MVNPEYQQDPSPERTIRDIAERAVYQAADDVSTRRRQRFRMLQHYIELISEYQDARRSTGVGEPPSEPDTPQQDSSYMPPPLELVQSIRDAGGDLPTCDAVIISNLQQMSQRTGRDTILYAGAFRHGDRGPSPDAVINEDDIATFGDILNNLNQRDQVPDPNLSFHPHPHAADSESSQSADLFQAMTDNRQRQLDLILHSPGGTLPATQAIVRALRGRYTHIRAFVPQRAMSAATMLACAADQIILGGFASLSPANPLVVVPTMGGSMLMPADAVVEERNELARRLQNHEGTGEDVIAIAGHPPGLYHDASRIITESNHTLAGWIEAYSRSPNAPDAHTSQYIADWITSYYQHLDHASVLTLADLQNHSLNARHMNDYADVQEHCMQAFHAAQVAFMLTGIVKVVRCHLD